MEAALRRQSAEIGPVQDRGLIAGRGTPGSYRLLHVVVQILPEEVALWSKEEVVKRWMRLYPRQDQNPEMRAEVLAGNAERIATTKDTHKSEFSYKPSGVFPTDDGKPNGRCCAP